MGTVRQRRKTKNPSSRTSRKPPKLLKPNTPKDVAIMVDGIWDSKKTFDQNYSSNSIIQNPNHLLSSLRTQNNLVKFNSVRVNNENDDNSGSIFRALPQEPSSMSNIIHSDPTTSSKTSSSSSKLISSLEKASKISFEKGGKPVSKEEFLYLKTLTSIHGNNYHRMQMDHKRNFRQLRSSELERLFERVKNQPEDLFY